MVWGPCAWVCVSAGDRAFTKLVWLFFARSGWAIPCMSSFWWPRTENVRASQRPCSIWRHCQKIKQTLRFPIVLPCPKGSVCWWYPIIILLRRCTSGVLWLLWRIADHLVRLQLHGRKSRLKFVLLLGIFQGSLQRLVWRVPSCSSGQRKSSNVCVYGGA